MTPEATGRPGGIRLHRTRKHNLGDWTLRCESLSEAVEVVTGVAAHGLPIGDLTVQRFTDGMWRDVPADELREVPE